MKQFSNLKGKKVISFSATFIIVVSIILFSCKKQQVQTLTIESLVTEYGLKPASATEKATKNFNTLQEAKAYLENERKPFSISSKSKLVSKVIVTNLLTKGVTSIKPNSTPVINSLLTLNTDEPGGGGTGGSVGGCHSANYSFHEDFTVSTTGYDDDMSVDVSYNTSGGVFTWSGTSVIFINHTGTITDIYASTSGGSINWI